MNLDIPGLAVTTRPVRGPDGLVVHVTVVMSRRFQWRLWLGVRLVRLAAWVLPPIARRALAERMFKESL